MSEPTTEAGRNLLRVMQGVYDVSADVTAIEAEARASLDVERLTEALRSLDRHWSDRIYADDLAADIAAEYARTPPTDT